MNTYLFTWKIHEFGHTREKKALISASDIKTAIDRWDVDYKVYQSNTVIYLEIEKKEIL